MQRPKNDGFLILDYGSQYTLLIARRLRELGVYCEMLPGECAAPPAGFKYYGIILSGGPDSVTEEKSRRLPAWVLKSEVPVLGICYGLQLLVQEMGGSVRSGTKREYGRATLSLNKNLSGPAAKVFGRLKSPQVVWMSHGDDADRLPSGFEVVGRTDSQVAAALCHQEKPIVGLQFHPEVHHSEDGLILLRNFVFDLCNAPVNWDAHNMRDALMQDIRSRVGDGHVLCACSGGVDSTTAAALLVKSLKAEQVTAVFCDHGLMRKNEVAWVAEKLRSLGAKDVVVLDAAKAFFTALQGVEDPEKKRQIIGRLFIEEFEAFAKQKGGFTHLAQGTLYPDVIESAGHGSGSKLIKSHHNVGGLPEKLHLPLVEPFRYLFKDEVRRLGVEIGLPPELVERHPFPGPGLSVRILGEVTRERVAILQEVDDVFIQALRDKNLYHAAWQAFAVLLPVKTVGVMGDSRTYQNTVALRAVTSVDGMTADVAALPLSFLTQVASEIVQRVHGVNRVVYDITSKPPATIEWE